VVQVKRESVRNAIIDSARDLFAERGYHGTTLLDIAEVAGIGVSSLYSYFPSKIHLLYAVFDPWYREAFERLERRVAKETGGRARLRCLLLGIWRDIPTENIGLANSLMEALASADPSQKKPMPLLRWSEERLAILLKQAIAADPARPVNYDLLSNLFIMAYDGFVINRRLNDLRDIEAMAEAMCDLILGPEQAAGITPPRPKSR
jgi:AcrR family transcriptional regulator